MLRNSNWMNMRKSFFSVATVLFFCLALEACSVKNSVPQAGTIVRDTISGVPCCVYLPYCYTERQHESFPVLYLQHGMFGSEDDWSTQGNLLNIMDSLLQSNEVVEMVVIMPDNFLGSLPPAERQALIDAPNVTPDGEPIDVKMGSAHWRKLTYEQERGYEMSGYWETHFQEFMTEVETRYRVSSEPAHRSIAGLSMGGYHTQKVAQQLHGQFAYIGIFSALIATPYSEQVYEQASLYWIGMGQEDFLYDQLQEYRRWLEQNHVEYTYYESTGGHVWPNWQDYIYRFLTKIR